MIRREIGKKGGLKGIVQAYGLIGSADLALSFIFGLTFHRLYSARNDHFGLAEALLCPRSVDCSTRYIAVSNELRRHDYHSLLDVGGGPGEISRYLPRDTSLCVLDIEKETLLSSVRLDSFSTVTHRRACLLVGDGCHLPFQDKAFDVVLSVDTIEHIPSEVRGQFLQELRRVGKIVVLCFPVESEDRLYRAGEYDRNCQEIYRNRFGFEEPWTAQHIQSGHPKIEEIRTVFPTAKYIGHKNCDVWLKCQILQRKPIVGFLAGLMYYLYWTKRDNVPPYYEVIVID